MHVSTGELWRLQRAGAFSHSYCTILEHRVKVFVVSNLFTFFYDLSGLSQIRGVEDISLLSIQSLKIESLLITALGYHITGSSTTLDYQIIPA